MIAHVSGVSAALIYEVIPGADPAWRTGPLAIPIPESARQSGWATVAAADVDARSAYFDPGVQGALYGANSPSGTRWAEPCDARLDAARVWGVEVVLLPTATRSHALLVVHVDIDDPDPAAVLERLTRVVPTPGRGLSAELETLLPNGWQLLDAHHRATSVTFGVQQTVRPGPPKATNEAHLDGRELSLWVLASATPLSSFTPTRQTFSQGCLLELSTSWSSLVLREGVGLVAWDANDAFIPMARVLVHSVYLDVVLLVRMQMLIAFDMLRALAARGLSKGDAAGLIALERDLFDFRRRVWWTTTGWHGNANALLTAAQRVHGLPDQLQALISDVSDAARLAQSIGTARAGAALAVISLVGVPLTAAYAGAALLPWDGWLMLLCATGVALVLSVVLATLTPLRELLQGWRGGGE